MSTYTELREALQAIVTAWDGGDLAAAVRHAASLINIDWQDASTATYTAESATINGHTVSVCLDDEGPMRPAFYWDMDNRTIDGWAGSVEQARADAIAAADTPAAFGWPVLEDILNSIKLAQESGDSDIYTTVCDYVGNTYGDD